MSNPHILVFANEKGGSGKTTSAVHVAVSLAAAGLPVAALDLDARQRSFARYMENRAAYARKRGMALPHVPVAVIDETRDGADELFDQALAQAPGCLVIDTPGRDSPLARRAIARADSLVTPINDSFLDLDLMGQVDAETFKVTRPGVFAETVWKARQQRARHDGGQVDWVVLRNRLSTLEARNRKRVGGALEELAKRIGFRVAPGLSERVIYRELFPKGLTLLDMEAFDEVSMSHVAARAELRALVEALGLRERVLAA